MGGGGNPGFFWVLLSLGRYWETGKDWTGKLDSPAGRTLHRPPPTAVSPQREHQLEEDFWFLVDGLQWQLHGGALGGRWGGLGRRLVVFRSRPSGRLTLNGDATVRLTHMNV